LNQTLLIALLNPTISSILACAFLLAAAMSKQRYVLLVALSYGCTCAGFLLQGFDFGLGLPASRLLSNSFFFTGTFMIAAAIVRRRGVAVPIWSLGTCAAAGLAGVAWFLFVQPNFAARVHVVSLAIGAMCLIVAFRLHRAGPGDFLDGALKWLAALRGVDMIGRPLLMSAFGMELSIGASLANSTFWLSMSLSSLIFSLLIALVLFARVASDMIGELSVESRTDPLSGLLNRRGFEEGCAPHFADGIKGLPICLIVADLDHFKSINDTHGHAAGDGVIRAFGRLVLEVAGRGAIAGRIGGEEFAILIPGTTPQTGRLVAEGLRAALASGPLSGVPESVGTVTCSFGVGTANAPARLDTLYREADAALLKAKHCGRNRVETSWDTGPLPPVALTA
jgi:diguanylate cyclase (GGDEF)-like protein